MENNFQKMTIPQQLAQNEFDLRELKDYYGSWDELRKVIDELEERDWEEYGNRQYEGDGNFADNH